MSKNVKSNNKNTKKSNSKSKKSSRNIYKIETLEPRLMMDAEPLDPALESNLDIQQFDSYVEQIGSLSEDIGDKAVASLGQFDKIDFTQFGLADKANAAVLNIFLQFNADPQFAKAEVSNSHEAFAVPASKRSCDKQSCSGDTLVFLCGERAFC